MAAQDMSEATLELTLLSANVFKKSKPSSSSSSKKFLLSRSPSSSSFAVAWIEPSIKKSTKTTLGDDDGGGDNLLHFPLPPSILRNPSSLLTIQILSSRLPFATPKLLGTATLPLSSLRLARYGEVRMLELRKPSDRCRGTVRITARILWCLGEIPEPPDLPCPSRPPPPPPMDFVGADLPYIVDPSAPPMPEGDSEGHDLMSVDSAAPMMEDETRDCCDCPSVDSRDEDLGIVDDTSEEQFLPINTQFKQDDNVNDDIQFKQDDNVNDDIGKGKGAWRSFFLGLASGSMVIVLMGAAGFSDG